MSKGKVLLICYYFPPLGLAGVTRPLNLFKYLPQHGYDCDVLTVKPVAYRKYEPELLQGLDASRIHRAGSRDPQRLMYLLGIREVNSKTIERGGSLGESLFPDSKVGWVAPAVRLGKKLHRQHSYRAVISTSPPISSHLVGMRLSEQTRVPWIADFRDFWTSHPIDKSYAKLQMKERAQNLLRRIQQTSAARVAVNQSIANYVGATRTISNGFDPALTSVWSIPPARGTFIIGLLGSFSDLLPIEPLLRVFARLRENHPEQFGAVSLCQVGSVDADWFRRQLGMYELVDRCACLGLQSRMATVERLASSAALYLAVTPAVADVTPSRAYDLLASGRPLLVYAPLDSEVARLLAGCELAYRFDDTSIDSAVDWLNRQILLHRSGKLEVRRKSELVERYNWIGLAGQMAEVIDEVVP